jgi:hypothetical protein
MWSLVEVATWPDRLCLYLRSDRTGDQSLRTAHAQAESGSMTEKLVLSRIGA